MSLAQWLKEDIREFKNALEIYEEARYSRHEMDLLKRQILSDAKDKVQNKIRISAKFFSKLKYRLLYCIY